MGKNKLQKKGITALEKTKESNKQILSAEFYLGTSIGFFLAALSHIEEAIKQFSSDSGQYKFYMTIFIIFLVLSFFLFGIYLGKRSERSHMNK